MGTESDMKTKKFENIDVPVAEPALERRKNVPEITMMDSFFDLLNRDQRTTKTIELTKGERSTPSKVFNTGSRSHERIVYENCDKCTNNKKNSDNKNFTNFREYNKPTSFKSDNVKRFHIDPFCFFSEKKLKRTEKRINFRNFINRLGDVFIIGVCILTIVKVPTTMSAPTSHHSSRDEGDDSKPNWLYPCGKSNQQMLNEYDLMTSTETDAEIVKHVIIQAEIALAHAESFKKEYVRKTFDMSFEKHHEIWIDNRYDWLPNTDNEIPKKLGKSVKSGHLESKGFDEFMKKIYEYLQKFGVGIEQVARDQAKSNGEFQEQFNMTEIHLEKVLCELRNAMIERGIIPTNNVERSLMGDEYRNMESPSYRNLRDWLIFRDYMNGLEYVIEVFKYIEKNLTT